MGRGKERRKKLRQALPLCLAAAFVSSSADSISSSGGLMFSSKISLNRNFLSKSLRKSETTKYNLLIDIYNTVI